MLFSTTSDSFITQRDIFGIVLAILGAVTVVLSANPSDVRLNPDGLIRAISQRPFVILSVVYVLGATILVSLSSRRVGQEVVYVDIGACALFGGFTVLATKAISTLLTMEWYQIFKEWITYPVFVVGTTTLKIHRVITDDHFTPGPRRNRGRTNPIPEPCVDEI